MLPNSSWVDLVSAGVSEGLGSLFILCSSLCCPLGTADHSNIIDLHRGFCSASFLTQTFQLRFHGWFPKSECCLASFVTAVRSLITFVHMYVRAASVWLLIKQPPCSRKCLELRNYIIVQEQDLGWLPPFDCPVLYVVSPYSSLASLRGGHWFPVEVSLT